MGTKIKKQEYLRTTMNGNNDGTDEIKSRLEQARSTFNETGKAFGKGLQYKCKNQNFKMLCVFSAILWDEKMDFKKKMW